MGQKRLVVVGDRVLIQPEEEQRTEAGLYLPAGAVRKSTVRSGRVVATGPGRPLPFVGQDDDEPWKQSSGRKTQYLPMQVQEGDFALFFGKDAVEINFEGQDYLIVSEGSILVLVREDE